MSTLEHPEIAAIRDLARAAPRGAASALELRGAVCLAVPAAPGSLMVNHVAGLGLDEPADEETLDAVEAFYGRLGLRHAISLPPGARPSHLHGLLAERGYTRGYAWMKFRRGPGPVLEARTDLDVREVGREHAERFGRIVADAFDLGPPSARWLAALPGRPAWHCFGAFDAGEPVAAGALFADGGRGGWLSLGATESAHRGRGAQGALLAARIRRAAELGLESLTTETGERIAGRPDVSYRNILRAGFEEAYLRPNYVSPAAG